MASSSDPGAEGSQTEETSGCSYLSFITCVLLLLSVVYMANWHGGHDQQGKARQKSARIQLQSFSNALSAFQMLNGRYPTTDEGLAALVTRPSGVPAEKWEIQMRSIPLDAWGHPYVYVCPGVQNPDTYDLYSLGRDGASKSGGNDPDDINNWDPKSPRKRK